MGEIYEIYVDVYFIENVLLDSLILFMVALLMQKKTSRLRIALAGIVGGCGAVLQLYLINYVKIGYINYLISILIIDIAMLFTMYGARICNARDCMMGILYFHGVLFIFTKLLEYLREIAACLCKRYIYSDNVHIWIFLSGSLILSVVILTAVKYGRRRSEERERKRIYKVIIENGGKFAEIKALYDTGNSLTDPFNGEPVSIVEKTIMDELIDKEYIMCNTPEKYRIIPYKSIGKENGVLEGLKIDKMTVIRDERPIVFTGVIIALYVGKLSENGGYQMILNQGCM